jgi:hypothetical protein
MAGPIRLRLLQDRLCVAPNDRQVLVCVGIQRHPTFDFDSFRRSEVALVMDCSGSMREPIIPGQDPAPKLDKAIEGVWAAVELLGPDDVFSVIGFDSRPSVVLDRISGHQRRDVLQGGRAQVEERLRGQFGGWTDIHAALSLARERLKGGGGDTIRRIILLSDGAANLPQAQAVELAVQAAEECGREGILIDVLGYGYGADMLPDLLSAIAHPTGGEWVHVNKPPSEILRDKMKSSRKIFASGVVLTLTIPKNVQARDVYRTEPVITYLGAAPLTASQRTCYMRANQLELGKDYTWMIEIEAPAGINGLMPLIDANLSLRLAGGQSITDKASLTINLASSQSEAAQRDRRFILVIEQARLNKLERELSEAQARKDGARMKAVLTQMISRCRDIGLESQAVVYQRIQDNFAKDQNFPRAALEAASTSTSAVHRASTLFRSHQPPSGRP